MGKTRFFALTLCLVVFAAAIPTAAASQGQPVPAVHTTDLYRPHGDPDDHWDLATVYALACGDYLELEGIVGNYTRLAVLEGQDVQGFGDPDALSVAQMNHLTAMPVPFMVGYPRRLPARGTTVPDASESDLAGAKLILQALEETDRPVDLYITGQARDVAIAGSRHPELFAEECRRIYLVAGLSDSDTNREWNCQLDPYAFSTIFDLPCDIYWLPCFEDIRHENDSLHLIGGEYCSLYSFRQEEILPGLSPRVQKFFAYMFRDGHYQQEPKEPTMQWLRYLRRPKEKDVLREHNQKSRRMWSTPAFFHSAGLTVTKDGDIRQAGKRRVSAAYSFQPVNLSCTDRGVVDWSRTDEPSNHYILHVDPDHYEDAMTEALRSLLQELP